MKLMHFSVNAQSSQIAPQSLPADLQAADESVAHRET